jgi:hypothetical protein
MEILHPFINNIMATEIKSISVSRELSKLAEDNKISWSEAARVGMSLILSEKGIDGYDNQLNIFRKLNILREQLEKTSQELFELKNGKT